MEDIKRQSMVIDDFVSMHYDLFYSLYKEDKETAVSHIIKNIKKKNYFGEIYAGMIANDLIKKFNIAGGK